LGTGWESVAEIVECRSLTVAVPQNQHGLDYFVMPSCHKAHSAVLYNARAVVICPR
jgi:hypothetical protein